jgi:arylsulfatase A-like enzyme
MTGRFGIHNGVVGHGGAAADLRTEGSSRGFADRLRHESLPGFLRHYCGLHTTCISPFGDRHSSWNFYAGFNEIHDTGKCGMESAEEITPTVLKWIEANAADDNWYLHINYWDPHTPYRAPADFGNPFENEPLNTWITPDILEKHRAMVGPHGAREINMYDSEPNPQYPRHPGELRDMNDVRRMIDGYDCGIRYLDDHIARIFNALKSQGVFDDLIIIISADHAENMGELGIYGEHATADYPNCRIPMIIRWPGSSSGHIDHGFHYNLDLPPTLADLFGKAAIPSWDGQSYASAIRNGADCGREFLIVSQCAHVCQRGVRFGDWMYVRTYHDGYHLFPQEMLFNVEADPHEQVDLAAERSDICLEAVHRLTTWHDDVMLNSTSDVDPLWTVIREGGPFHAKGYLQSYCKRLESTGRAWAIPELRRRHPNEFPQTM